MSSFVSTEVNPNMDTLKKSIETAVKKQENDVSKLIWIYTDIKAVTGSYHHLKCIAQVLDLEYARILHDQATAAIQQGHFAKYKDVNMISLGVAKEFIFERDRIIPNVNYRRFNDRCTFAKGLIAYFNQFQLDLYDTSLPWDFLVKFKGLFFVLILRGMERTNRLHSFDD